MPGEDEDGEHGREEHRGRLRRDHESPVVDPVGEDAGEEAEDGEGDEAAERERADRDRRVRQLDDEPGERDVLHPRPADRDHLAGEEEAVVAVPPQARERAVVERDEQRGHSSLMSGSIAPSIAATSSGSQVAQPVGQPGRPPGADALQQPRALLGERQPDAAAVAGVAHALDQPGALEPVDVAGERGRGDALLGRQLAQARARGSA